jgi:hypothetical protein
MRLLLLVMEVVKGAPLPQGQPLLLLLLLLLLLPQVMLHAPLGVLGVQGCCAWPGTPPEPPVLPPKWQSSPHST